MPNTLYNIAKQAFLTSITLPNTSLSNVKIDWVNDKFGAALVSSDYVLNKTSNFVLSDIPPETILSKVTLETLVVEVSEDGSSDFGTAYANSVTFTEFPDDLTAGAQADYIVIYRDAETGNDSDNILISYIDTAEGLPVIYNTGDIQVNWDNTNPINNAGRVFRL